MLIKCTECNHDVSEYANNCPQCGCLMEKLIQTDLSAFEIDGTVLKKYKGYYKKVVIPKGITEISQNAFCNRVIKDSIYQPYNVSMHEIVIPDSVTDIDDYAFSNCISIKEINIPNSVIHIGAYAFKGCTSIKEVNVPNGVISIGVRAFAGCKNLQKVYLSKGLDVVPDVFYDCHPDMEIIRC